MDELMDASGKYAEAQWRYSVLGECVTLLEAMRRRVSKNEANQVAKDGYERAFDEDGRRLETLRQMMRELRAESSRQMERIAEIRRQ